MRQRPPIGLRAIVVGVLAAVLLTACGGGDEPSADQQSAPAAPAQDSTPAPSMPFELFSGEETSMAAYEASPTVVNFWASWCPPCIDEMPDLEEVNQQFPDVEFLGINTQDELDEAQRLAEETGVTYDLALDPEGELFRSFGVISMPTTFFVSADGRVLAEHSGAITKDDLVEQVEEQFGL